jgi:hypothetical protein
MKKILLLICVITFLSCKSSSNSTEGADNNETTIDYLSEVDLPQNEGQNWLVEPKVAPKSFYVCKGKDLNDFGRYETNKSDSLEGLQYANMCESLAGIVNRAVSKKSAEVGIWLDGIGNSYSLCQQDLMNGGVYKKVETDGLSLLKSGVYSSLIKGYVLTDVVNNPESSVVAAVASHVYYAIIVDVRDEKIYKKLGLIMVYDARYKTTKDSWNEFKSKCNNKALVLMPAQTNDMKDFAIANDYFVMNITRDNKTGKACNMDLLNEVLDWLAPCSPVYGWENIDEHSFVQPISERGHLMVCCNFFMNMPLTSLNYSLKQKDLLVNVMNPAKIDYSKNDINKYVSYYLSDGDNVQWVFHIWYDNWFKHPESGKVKMAYGIPATNLNMIAPPVYKNIVLNQDPENTLVENCGGGYIYIDAYASKKDTQSYLDNLAKKVSSNMRQHRIKVLGLFTNDAKSQNAQNAYKAFIQANNRLEGIIAVQYVPYNGGHGEVFWIKNSDGIEIPVITVKYTIWNFGRNEDGQGTPAYIASKIKEEGSKFSLVDVHAWSTFADIGTSDDVLGETIAGNVFGAGAAAMCQRRLPSSYICVSLQELIWRMRMEHNKNQTENILKAYK